jgi:hypothetical protein
LREQLARDYPPCAGEPAEIAQRKLVAAFNERVSAVQLELDLMAPTTLALTRMAWCAAALGLLLAYWFGPQVGAWQFTAWEIAIAVSGGCAALLCGHFGRQARARAQSVRQGWNRIAHVLLRKA